MSQFDLRSIYIYFTIRLIKWDKISTKMREQDNFLRDKFLFLSVKAGIENTVKTKQNREPLQDRCLIPTFRSTNYYLD